MSTSPEVQPRVHKYLSEELTIRAASVIATQVVEDMRAVHNSAPIPTVATGRAMIGALLMASHLKDSQELSLYFKGDGPLVTIFAEATFEGNVRAYCGNPQMESQIPKDGIFVGPYIGSGQLSVTHHLPMGGATPHRGMVEIRSGEVGDDIAYYLHQSSQIPSVVALGVHVNSYGRVEAAGGILIELMPGHTPEIIKQVEARVKTAPGISKRILEGATAADLIQDYLGDFKLLELEHPHPIQFKCRCSVERVHRSVILLGVDEIDSLIREGHSIDITCEFCGKKYVVNMSDLEKIRQDAYRKTLN